MILGHKWISQKPKEMALKFLNKNIASQQVAEYAKNHANTTILV
jgi:hypothetical protein